MALFAYNLKTTEEALVYITDCTLATVESLAMKKSRGKWEYERQIKIAQISIDHMLRNRIHHYGTRARVVIESYNGSVQLWADEQDVNRK